MTIGRWRQPEEPGGVIPPRDIDPDTTVDVVHVKPLPNGDRCLRTLAENIIWSNVETFRIVT